MNQASIESHQRTLKGLIEAVESNGKTVYKSRPTKKWYSKMDKLIKLVEWKLRVLKRFTKRRVCFTKTYSKDYFLV